jgi:hypothetical protein
VSVVLGSDVRLPPDFLAELAYEVPVFRDQTVATALAQADRLGVELPGARVLEASVTERDLVELRQRPDPECICFSSRSLERRFDAKLGYAERAAVAF